MAKHWDEYDVHYIYIIYLRCESTLKTTVFFMKESRMEAKSRGIPQDFCDFACAEQKYQIPDCALIVLYPLLWRIRVSCDSLQLLGPKDAKSITQNLKAVTKNFRGSPHIDQNDFSVQYALAVGDFASGGELCVEEAMGENNGWAGYG